METLGPPQPLESSMPTTGAGPSGGDSTPPAASYWLLEDDSSKWLMEDGTSFWLIQ